MHWLRIAVEAASLYSMRLPYTYQSALSYPLPPPSTIVGIVASALHRYEGIAPQQARQEAEAQLDGVNAAATEPLTAGTAMVRVTRVEGTKEIRCDALPRMFVHAPAVELWLVSREAPFLQRVRASLSRVPISLGDGESLATPVRFEEGNDGWIPLKAGDRVSVSGYVGQRWVADVDAGALLYWMAARLDAADQLEPYYVALVEGRSGWLPSPTEVTVTGDWPALQVGGRTYLFPPRVAPEAGERRRRGRVAGA